MDEALHRTLRLLRISGILGAAIRIRSGEYRLWLGDTAHGVRETGVVPAPQAASWLAARACAHFPKSDFVKVRAFLDRMAAEAEKLQD